MPLVLQRRGAILESTHPWSAALVRWTPGEPRVEWIGAPIACAWRSAAKPFQLWCALEALGDPALPEPALAVGAASHTAEPIHLEVVEAILARFALSPSVLRCAAHAPLYGPAADDILRAGGAFSDLHNNCSGKHAFMSAAAAARGWPSDYRAPDHPLQRRIRERITDWCGEAPLHGVDGCGVPTFGASIAAFARAWMSLAVALRPPAGAGADERLARIGRAMMSRPDLISGTERLDLALARAATEPMVTKIGAQGLLCMAFPARGLGVAVKSHSGDEPALAVAVARVLDGLGAWERPEHWPWAVVRNVAGAIVGERVSAG